MVLKSCAAPTPGSRLPPLPMEALRRGVARTIFTTGSVVPPKGKSAFPDSKETEEELNHQSDDEATGPQKQGKSRVLEKMTVKYIKAYIREANPEQGLVPCESLWAHLEQQHYNLFVIVTECGESAEEVMQALAKKYPEKLRVVRDGDGRLQVGTATMRGVWEADLQKGVKYTGRKRISNEAEAVDSNSDEGSDSSTHGVSNFSAASVDTTTTTPTQPYPAIVTSNPVVVVPFSRASCAAAATPAMIDVKELEATLTQMAVAEPHSNILASTLATTTTTPAATGQLVVPVLPSYLPLAFTLAPPPPPPLMPLFYPPAADLTTWRMPSPLLDPNPALRSLAPPPELAAAVFQAPMDHSGALTPPPPLPLASSNDSSVQEGAEAESVAFVASILQDPAANPFRGSLSVDAVRERFRQRRGDLFTQLVVGSVGPSFIDFLKRHPGEFGLKCPGDRRYARVYLASNTKWEANDHASLSSKHGRQDHFMQCLRAFLTQHERGMTGVGIQEFRDAYTQRQDWCEKIPMIPRGDLVKIIEKHKKDFEVKKSKDPDVKEAEVRLLQ